MIKKISILFMLMIFITTAAACSKVNNDAPTKEEDNMNSSTGSQLVEYGVAGNIIDISTSEDGSTLGTIEVEGPEDNGAQYDKAVVTITSDTKIYTEDSAEFKDLAVGMYVNVFFEEDSAKESYPVQATAKQVNVIPDDPVADEADKKDGK